MNNKEFNKFLNGKEIVKKSIVPLRCEIAWRVRTTIWTTRGPTWRMRTCPSAAIRTWKICCIRPPRFTTKWAHRNDNETFWRIFKSCASGAWHWVSGSRRLLRCSCRWWPSIRRWAPSSTARRRSSSSKEYDYLTTLLETILRQMKKVLSKVRFIILYTDYIQLFKIYNYYENFSVFLILKILNL